MKKRARYVIIIRDIIGGIIMTDKIMKIGFNIGENRVISKSPEFMLTAHAGKGADFVVCHTDETKGTLAERCEAAEKIARYVDEAGAKLIANFEWQNFVHGADSKQEFLDVNHADGTHRLEIKPEFVKALASRGNLEGLMYDEFEHCIINRNVSIYMASKFKTDLPVFPVADTTDAVIQGETLSAQIKQYVDNAKKKHGDYELFGEHVWPVLFHTFARNGITPNFKSQKESCSNIQHAIAAGAALEYGTPLSNCVDMWFRLKFPGHTPDELYANLCFAYLAGVNRVYVENASGFCDYDESKNAYRNGYGRNFRKFADEYIGKDRDYDVSDFRPEVGIIRYDDTFWGQGNTKHFWRYMLFGNPAVKPDYRAKEYLLAFNLLTHGETDKGGLSWGRVSPWVLRPHRSFASLNSCAVFDERVTKDKLESLRLCFLCGYTISNDTIKAVCELVRDNGLTVITTKRFIPKQAAAAVTSGFCEIKDGKGKWIVVDSFANPKLRKAVEPFSGNKGEMRLTFTDREIVMKINETGEGFTVIKNEKK